MRMPRTLVCVPITAEDVPTALTDAAQAANAGANLVEFRVDALYQGAGDTEAIAGAITLAAESPLPCILTCRPAYEGGHYEGDDASRVSLVEALCTADTPPRYVDFEFLPYSRSHDLRTRIDAAIASANDATGLILSTHDFQGRPQNLHNILAQMRAVPSARILKLAFRARSVRDNIEVFELLAEKDRPTIALAMGEHGLPSRVLAPKFGAFLTFASLRDTSATAPGQPTIHDLLHLYRFNSITDRTRVYALLGHPVAHSISPHVHNAGFEAVGHDAVYLPLDVPPEWEHFKASVLSLLDATHLDFSGASITLPHKLHILRLASEDTTRRWIVDDVAARVGAANTLTIQLDGACHVTNTDVEGILRPLAARLPDLSAARVAILGAGGAARAGALALTDAGATVALFARNRDRAEAIVAALAPTSGKLSVGAWEDLPDSRCDAYINCTPVGMSGGPDPAACILPDGTFDTCEPGTVFFDTVYNPIDTPLVRTARERAFDPITGQEMFVAQAAAQFTRWTGIPAPLDLFTRVSHETLASDPPS